MCTAQFLLPVVQAKVTLTTEGTGGGGVTCLAYMKRRSHTAEAIKLYWLILYDSVF